MPKQKQRGNCSKDLKDGANGEVKPHPSKHTVSKYHEF